MVLVVGVTAIAVFYFYIKPRNQLDTSENHKQFDEPLPYRSLFEPTDEQIRVLEREEEQKLQTLENEKAEQVLIEKREKVLAFQNEWMIAPDKRKTVELLRLTTLCENAEIFSQISQSVIKLWRANKIENLTAPDLADLLDSHFRTLPQQERTSGVGFLLKQEIAELRPRLEES